jgi:hypothetical protein
MMRERILKGTSSDGTNSLTADALSWRLPASIGQTILLLMRYPGVCQYIFGRLVAS